MKKLNNDIKNKRFDKLYLLHGNDAYLMESYAEKIKSIVLTPENEIMNFDLFSGNKVITEEIINSANTLPFLSEKRLVYVKDSGLFLSGRKNESENLIKTISEISSNTILVFFEKDIDKRGKLYKEISKVGNVVEVKSYTGKNLINWIKRKFSENKILISDNECSYLVKTVGNDMKTILSEITKLSDYKGNSGEISVFDIDKICIKSVESKVFDLIKEVGNKHTQNSIVMYKNMIQMKESPFLILSLMSRQFKIIYLCKRMIKEGYDKSDIVKEVGISPYFYNEYAEQGKNFSEKELQNAMKDCLETDYGIKSGKINDEIGVSMIIFKYSSN